MRIVTKSGKVKNQDVQAAIAVFMFEFIVLDSILGAIESILDSFIESILDPFIESIFESFIESILDSFSIFESFIESIFEDIFLLFLEPFFEPMSELIIESIMGAVKLSSTIFFTLGSTLMSSSTRVSCKKSTKWYQHKRTLVVETQH